jgi:hypothetical protein
MWRRARCRSDPVKSGERRRDLAQVPHGPGLVEEAAVGLFVLDEPP